MALTDDIQNLVDQVFEFVNVIMNSLEDVMNLLLDNIDKVEIFFIKIINMFITFVESLLENKNLIRSLFIITPLLPMVFLLLNFIESF